MIFRLSSALLLIGLLEPAPLIAQKSKAPSPPPLVRMQAPPPIQVVETPPEWHYGAWGTMDMGDYTIASTINDSGSAFGVVCGKDCVWFVNFQTHCTVGHTYPAMINGPAGSYAIDLRCYNLGERWILTFAMTDESIDAVSKGGELGFAFPFANGKFGVSRFSLSGGEDAIVKAMNVILKRREASQEGLRDFTI